jgi:hypothetical protein
VVDWACPRVWFFCLSGSEKSLFSYGDRLSFNDNSGMEQW